MLFGFYLLKQAEHVGATPVFDIFAVAQFDDINYCKFDRLTAGGYTQKYSFVCPLVTFSSNDRIAIGKLIMDDHLDIRKCGTEHLGDKEVCRFGIRHLLMPTMIEKIWRNQFLVNGKFSIFNKFFVESANDGLVCILQARHF